LSIDAATHIDVLPTVVMADLDVAGSTNSTSDFAPAYWLRGVPPSRPVTIASD